MQRGRPNDAEGFLRSAALPAVILPRRRSCSLGPSANREVYAAEALVTRGREARLVERLPSIGNALDCTEAGSVRPANTLGAHRDLAHNQRSDGREGATI